MSRHMELRAELWSRVYAGVAASTSGKQEAALRWADESLKQFDARFDGGPFSSLAAEEERAIIELLSVCVEGRKPEGEPTSAYLRRMLDQIRDVRATQGLRQ